MERRRPWKTLTLPEHLCESDDPVKTAKAYTLQLLTLSDQVGGPEMLKELSSWIQKLDLEQLERSRGQYEEAHKLASSVIPFIRTDLKSLLSDQNCGYKIREDSSRNPENSSRNPENSSRNPQNSSRNPQNSSRNPQNSSRNPQNSSRNPENSPKNPENSSENPANIPVELDGFLFEDLDEALAFQNLESDRLCSQCKSTKIHQLDLKLTSSSVESMINLFHVALKKIKFNSISIVGSAEGALVYGSFILTNSTKILSYESDKFLKLQQNIVKKYQMESRVEVRNLDLLASDDNLDTDLVIFGDNFKDFGNVVMLQDKVKVGVEGGKIVVCFRKDSNIEKILPILKKLPRIQPMFSSQEFCICCV